MHSFRPLLIGLTILMVGCSENSLDDAASSAKMDISAEASQRQRSEYLAYSHRVSVDMPKKSIRDSFNKISTACASDEKYECTILHSSLNSGDYASANIEMRVKPDGVGYFLDLVSQDGELTNKSTDVEDLADAIVDNKKRLEMLYQYRDRLEKLEEKSVSNVESLIRIASELSDVQSDIEHAEGKRAKLLKRTKMDIINISLYSRNKLSFWDPISNSLEDFVSNLSEGISQVITAIAYLIPWVILFILFLYIVRVIWRKTKSK